MTRQELTDDFDNFATFNRALHPVGQIIIYFYLFHDRFGLFTLRVYAGNLLRANSRRNIFFLLYYISF